MNEDYQEHITNEPAAMEEVMNAQAEAMRKIKTNIAIGAFRAVELKKLQLEIREYQLEQSLRRIDRDRYFKETEEIREQYQEKRREYARLGRLPKIAG